MKIRIALIVGDNGEFSVGKFEGDKTDWAFLTDIVGVYNEKTKDIDYPTLERRYIIEADVEPPTPPETVAASSVEEVTDEWLLVTQDKPVSGDHTA